MKIAFCAPADIHGLARAQNRPIAGVTPGLGSTATTPLIIELLRRGHNVTLYTLSNDLRQEAFYDWDALRIFAGPSREFGSPRDFYRQEIRYLKQAIQADGPDFVHAHWTYEFALAASGSRVPMIATIHDLPWNVLKYFRDRCRVVRLMMAYKVALSRGVFTAVSPDAARHYRRWLRPWGFIRTIPNFLQDSVFAVGKATVPESGRPFTFVTILQGWSRRKNGSCALKAFQIARRHIEDCRMIMIGTGYEDGGAAYEWAKLHGLADGVIFRGPLQHDAMLEFVQRETDVLVHPSLDEAFSVTVLESMALRKPIIAGMRTPGLRWVLQDGNVGLLVDARKPAEVAEAMQRLSADTDLRKRLSAAAFQKAWNNFRADAVVPQYETLYEEFLSGLRSGQEHSRIEVRA